MRSLFLMKGCVNKCHKYIDCFCFFAGSLRESLEQGEQGGQRGQLPATLVTRETRPSNLIKWQANARLLRGKGLDRRLLSIKNHYQVSYIKFLFIPS